MAAMEIINLPAFGSGEFYNSDVPGYVPVQVQLNNAIYAAAFSWLSGATGKEALHAFLQASAGYRL